MKTTQEILQYLEIRIQSADKSVTESGEHQAARELFLLQLAAFQGVKNWIES